MSVAQNTPSTSLIGRAVVRNSLEVIEYQTRDGVDILHFKINTHRLFDRLQLDIASDSCPVSKPKRCWF